MNFVKAYVAVASPLKVTIPPETTQLSSNRLSSYTPVLGDLVITIVDGVQLIVLGKVVAG